MSARTTSTRPISGKHEFHPTGVGANRRSPHSYIYLYNRLREKRFARTPSRSHRGRECLAKWSPESIGLQLLRTAPYSPHEVDSLRRSRQLSLTTWKAFPVTHA